MSASFQRVFIPDPANPGAGLEGAVGRLSWLVSVDRTGLIVADPAFVELGGGGYGYLPPVDNFYGVIALDGATVAPVAHDAARQPFFLVDGDGNPLANQVGSLSWTKYVDDTGTPIGSPPAFQWIASGWHIFAPVYPASPTMGVWAVVGGAPRPIEFSLPALDIAPAVPPSLTLPTTSTATGRAAGSSGDIRLQWDVATLAADVSIVANDLETDAGLETAVLLSLFIDAPAHAGDVLPDGTTAKGGERGWWGDAVPVVTGDVMGSRLWLLERSKNTPDIPRRVEDLVGEALAWLISDRVAKSVDVVADGVSFTATIKRPNAGDLSFRYGHAWLAQEARL